MRFGEDQRNRPSQHISKYKIHQSQTSNLRVTLSPRAEQKLSSRERVEKQIHFLQKRPEVWRWLKNTWFSLSRMIKFELHRQVSFLLSNTTWEGHGKLVWIWHETWWGVGTAAVVCELTALLKLLNWSDVWSENNRIRQRRFPKHFQESSFLNSPTDPRNGKWNQ